MQNFWKYYTGTRPGPISVVTDRQTIAVWVERVLSPAEQEVARTDRGCSTLQQFGDRILEQANIARVPVVADRQVLGILLREAVIHYLRARTD